MSAEGVELLAGSPFFEGFDRSDVAELAGQARMVAFEAGERVFAEGEPPLTQYALDCRAPSLTCATLTGRRGVSGFLSPTDLAIRPPGRLPRQPARSARVTS